MSDFDVSLTPAAPINVSVAGGVGPQGPTGPAGGVTSVNGATGALTLAAVGGSWAVAGTTLTLTVTGGGASTWSALTGKPFTSIGTGLAVDGSGVLSATGLTSVSWADITGKPATFAPSAHTHAIADTTGLQTALDLKAPLASPTFTGTVSGVTKAMVGLGSVDNTADASKPVSTLQAAADAAVQAFSIQRANHTGTQAVGTITGLGTLATQSGTFSGTSSGTNTGDQTISLTGDVTGSGTGSFAATLSASGVTAGTYTSVTVDAKGRVTAGTATQAWSTITGTPTTLAGYGITDGVVTSDSRLSDARTPTAGSVTDASITTSGLSAGSINWSAIAAWAASTAYAKGDLVEYLGIAYRRSVAGTSGATFNVTNWQQITPTTPVSHASRHQTGGSDAVATVVVTPTSLAADVNDWAIGTGDIFRVAGTAARNVTGIAAGTSGLAILLINVGSFALTLKHQSASSTAANRFTVPWTGDCVIPASGGAVVLVYDSTSSTWRVV